jgi:hypothetical protein
MDEYKARDVELRLALVEAELKAFREAWQRMEGAFALVKYASIVAGVGWAFLLWFRDHVKL